MWRSTFTSSGSSGSGSGSSGRRHRAGAAAPRRCRSLLASAPQPNVAQHAAASASVDDKMDEMDEIDELLSQIEDPRSTGGGTIGGTSGRPSRKRRRPGSSSGNSRLLPLLPKDEQQQQQHRRQRQRQRRAASHFAAVFSGLVGFVAVLNLRGEFAYNRGSGGTGVLQSARRLCGEDPNAPLDATTGSSSSRRRLRLFLDAIDADEDPPAAGSSSLWGTFFFSARRTARRLAEYGSCTFGDYVLALTLTTTETSTATTTATTGGYTGGGSSGGTYIVSPILASTSGDNSTTTSPLPPAPVNEYTDQSTTTTATATATTAVAPNDIAYAITIKHCPEGFLSGGSTIHSKVFYDAFSVLRHSICNCTDNNRYADPVTGEEVAVSRYHGTLYAFVHSSATVCSGPNSGECYFLSTPMDCNV